MLVQRTHLVMYLIPLVITVGFLIRLSLIPFDQTVTHDAKLYYYYAAEMAYQGRWPDLDYPLHNVGFPLILSSLFALVPKPDIDFLLLSNIQRIFTVVISTVTIPMAYLLCRQYFDRNWSFVGMALVALSPRLIQNAAFGITDPLYLLGVFCSLYFLKRNIILSFVLAGFTTIIRFEGIMLFGVILGCILLNRQKDKKMILGVAGALLLLFGIGVINTENGHTDGFITTISKEANTIIEFADNGILFSKLSNSIVYLGWTMVPLFIIPILPGFYYLARKRNWALILGVILLTIPGIVAYFDAYDTRYFFGAYPYFVLISLYGYKQIVPRITKSFINH